jgi:general secretion pathway protein N
VKTAPVFALSLCLAALAASRTHAGPTEDGGNPVAAIPLASLSATRERPLFSPSRRPPPVVADAPAVEAGAPQPSPSPAPSLLGTVIGRSDRIAVIVKGAEPPVSLRVGETAWGWKLRAVGPRSATFEGSGGTLTLGLPSAPPSPVEVSPAAPMTSAKDARSSAEGSP